MKDKGISQKSQAFKQNMMNDPYLNALRTVFGYALTCHKAQGSEFGKVLVMEEKFPYDEEQHWKWLYTSISRAVDKLVLIKV